MTLTGKQRRKLRALGHHLSPVILVGAKGVTPDVIAATDEALEHHELIKIKIGEGPEERNEAAERLARETRSELAQTLGHTALLYRRREKEPKIEL